MANPTITLDYSNIFSHFTSENGDTFFLSNSAILFPEDNTLDIYDTRYINANTPWTVLSWNLYGTIEHWWILSSLNRDLSYFYAKDGLVIRIIKPEYVNDVITAIKLKL